MPQGILPGLYKFQCELGYCTSTRRPKAFILKSNYATDIATKDRILSGVATVINITDLHSKRNQWTILLVLQSHGS